MRKLESNERVHLVPSSSWHCKQVMAKSYYLLHDEHWVVRSWTSTSLIMSNPPSSGFYLFHSENEWSEVKCNKFFHPKQDPSIKCSISCLKVWRSNIKSSRPSAVKLCWKFAEFYLIKPTPSRPICPWENLDSVNTKLTRYFPSWMLASRCLPISDCRSRLAGWQCCLSPYYRHLGKNYVEFPLRERGQIRLIGSSDRLISQWTSEGGDQRVSPDRWSSGPATDHQQGSDIIVESRQSNHHLPGKTAYNWFLSLHYTGAVSSPQVVRDQDF